jgi:hypothetical protein
MRTRGFAFIDVVLVLDLIAVCAVLTIPTPPQPSQASSNEAKAIATLRELARKQALFQQGCYMDEDQDGRGEYGSVGELAGVSNLIRNGIGTPSPLSPPFLPSSFKTISASGQALVSGYLFILYLPSYGSIPAGLCDIALGGPSSAVDANNCESLWCAYAWPVATGTTGNRAFFVNQNGNVLSTAMDTLQYNGANLSPTYCAALVAATMNAPVGVPPMIGVDGNTWTRAP